MRLPRRVPWTSIAELDQICSWIFTDEHDLNSQLLAIRKLSAWRAITPLPHALESTLALLAVLVQDLSSQGPSSYLYLRQSYASALIRLVNGLVDPLQLGVYARSIASIANQLGLPQWLVELRHAATHEDLPSLELLREAAKESMNWILHNYFLPTINPSPVVRTQPSPLRPLTPTLKHYRSLLKMTTRDVSLQSRHRPAIQNVLKDVERWVAEAKVAANVAVGELGWDTGGFQDDESLDVKERWALEKLCDALLEKGVLVPLSKKKRTFPTDSFSPPDFSVQLWTPLLLHLQSSHPDFSTVLSNRIISYLLSDTSGPSSNGPANPSDTTFDMCLARWAMWILNEIDSEDSDTDFDVRKEAIITLITGLGPGASTSIRNRKAATALLQALCDGDSDMEAALSALQPAAQPPHAQWSPDNLAVMNERLTALMSSFTETETEDSLKPTLTQKPDETVAPGWRVLNENSGWKPSPIGVHVPALPQ